MSGKGARKELAEQGLRLVKSGEKTVGQPPFEIDLRTNQEIKEERRMERERRWEEREAEWRASGWTSD